MLHHSRLLEMPTENCHDFHIDAYDEIFYQLKGTIYVKHRDAAGHTQIAEVKEGEVMIINAFTPHLPIRPPETLGLVIERPRVAGEQDGIIWYCDTFGNTHVASRPVT